MWYAQFEHAFAKLCKCGQVFEKSLVHRLQYMVMQGTLQYKVAIFLQIFIKILSILYYILWKFLFYKVL